MAEESTERDTYEVRQHDLSKTDEILDITLDKINKDMRFKLCEKCNAIKPPRAHHCKICDMCVLRMDHHCIWLGTCVGIKN